MFEVNNRKTILDKSDMVHIPVVGPSKPSSGSGFPTYFSPSFVSSFAEAGREARLKPALFLREYSPFPTS